MLTLEQHFANYRLALIYMAVIGFLCFIALYFIPAGYGKFRSKKWGFSFNNKVAWIIMEIPTLIVTGIMLALSPKFNESVNMLPRIILIAFFVSHYIQRTLVFPFLLKGKGTMPILIVLMGMAFNAVNAFLINGWIFYFSPNTDYRLSWLYDPRFIIGAIIFITGMIINIRSDKYIRSLRKPGDSNHYFPNQGMYKYVTSANYFGELVEWTGFAILTWSLPGVLFVWWTAANLVPRSHAINKSYKEKFPEEFAKTKPKRIFPFVY